MPPKKVDGLICNFVLLTGNKSDFLLILSLEVDEGELMATLPIGLIGSAEFKSQYRKVWQSLQTYVTISNHFVLKGKGIRFQGTHFDCNNALQRLYFKVVSIHL